jgi:hypothetical protein
MLECVTSLWIQFYSPLISHSDSILPTLLFLGVPLRPLFVDFFVCVAEELATLDARDLLLGPRLRLRERARGSPMAFQ